MLYLPQSLPAVQALHAEGLDIREYALGEALAPDAVSHQPEGLRTVLLLNLMPEKEETERDLGRQLALTGLPLRMVPVRFPGLTYKHTPQVHMDTFYVDVEDAIAPFHHCTPHSADAPCLIVTGAPLENVAFEDVRYWEPLCRVLHWAEAHTYRTLLLCWAAFAELYRLYGIPLRHLPAKRFGVFMQHAPSGGGQKPWPCPVSRHIEVQEDMICHCTDIRVEALSAESGIGLLSSHEGRKIFQFGHLEYPADRLEREYLRDLGRGLPIDVPLHYYRDDVPARGIDFSWGEACRTFYKTVLSAQ